MKSIRLPIAVLLLVGLCPLPTTRAQELFYKPELTAKHIDLTLGTDWYGVYLQNKKIGYSKIERARAGDNLVETLVMSMKVTAFDKKAEMKITRVQTFETKPPYRLLKAVDEQSDGSSTTKVIAKRLDKGFEYLVNTAGKERKKTLADPGFDLADDFAAEVWMRSGPKIGDKILVRDLDIEEWKVDPELYTLKAIKTSLVAGVEVKFYEVEQESRKDKIKYISRYDSMGRMLSSNVAIFELRKETEEQAKNTEFGQDLFVLGMAKIDRAIGFTTTLNDLVLETAGKDHLSIKDGPRQSVVDEKGRQFIKLGKKYGKEVKVDDKEIAENLMETNAYPIADPKIKAMAEKAVGDAKTPREKAKRIVAYVSRFVIPTNVASVPNIPDLLNHKKGDCKSYALLTTTLCRAAGVPSREVAGLLYMGDDAKAFGGHAWNEVVLDGVWVPVDASLNQMDLDAGHISFGESRQAGGAMLQSLGKLTFKVVDSQTGK